MKKLLPFVLLMALFFLALSPVLFRLPPGAGESILPRFTRTPSEKTLYLDSSRPAWRRTEDLLSRMTLEEKTAQLLCTEKETIEKLFSGDLYLLPEEREKRFPHGMGVLSGVGRIHGGMGPEQTAVCINELQKDSRRNTRLGIPLLIMEEGSRSPGSTLFPSPMGLAASWNPEMTEKVWNIIAAEAGCRGITLLAVPPVENLGEYSLLSERMKQSAVKGIYGISPSTIPLTDPESWPDSGIKTQSGPLWFRVDDTFRGDKNIPGGSVLVSSPDNLRKLSRETGHPEETLLAGAGWGLNIDRGNLPVYTGLPRLLKEGKLKESVLDSLVRPVLLTKFRTGLFEARPADTGTVTRTVGVPENSRLARQAAEGAFVLLENRKGFLPLDPETTGTIAVIGPGADVPGLNEDAGKPPYHVSVYKGIKDFSRNRYQTTQSTGCGVKENPSDWETLEQAESLASWADVVLLVLVPGEQDGSCGGRQELLLENITDRGVPVILLILGDKPPVLPAKADRALAVITGFSPGQETGRALARLIFGMSDFTGRLPFPLKSAADRGGMPRYPFGYGKSLTDFNWSGIKNTNGLLTLQITNTGRQRGTETIQLYMNRRAVTRNYPDRELADFRQVTLEPGETRTVTFFTGRFDDFLPPDGELWLIPARDSSDNLFRIPLKSTSNP